MNEVFEILSNVFEELRSEIRDREYSVRTGEEEKARQELEKKNVTYEDYLSNLPAEDRNFLEGYMDVVDHAHYKKNREHITRDSWMVSKFLKGWVLFEKV